MQADGIGFFFRNVFFIRSILKCVAGILDRNGTIVLPLSQVLIEAVLIEEVDGDVSSQIVVVLNNP